MTSGTSDDDVNKRHVLATGVSGEYTKKKKSHKYLTFIYKRKGYTSPSAMEEEGKNTNK